MKNINPMLMTDFYKISHRIMSEANTEKIYSTFTPRSTRVKGINEVVFFGLQGFIKEYLIDYFNENFFNLEKESVVNDYKRIITYTLGAESSDTKHIEALHDLGYLPLKISALLEGTLVPIRVPMFVIENTHKDFYWLTNFLETFMSACLWKPTTSATIVKLYRDICVKWANDTCDSNAHVPFQCHNFSYRGMHSNDDAIVCGAGHALFFTGSDTIPSIQYLENYYDADVEKELVLASIPATEHSIQCQYQDDYRYLKRLITEIIPNGLVSVVADGYDYWKFIGEIVPSLKDEIMNRDGKCVVRPDSGIPADIICGDPNSNDELAKKGSVEVLWNTFGGTYNSKGYKVLDPHIGIIYGEAITPEIAEEIFSRLAAKGFSSENVVFGIGSYSLGYYTRDTFGMALKATHTIIDGKEINIFKDPKTDTSKIKKSQTGMIVVYEKDGQLNYKDGFNSKTIQSEPNLLREVFVDGKLKMQNSLSNIRRRVLNNES